MANEYSTGAVAIYVKTPKLGGAFLLGTSEQGPSRSTERSFKQMRNDLTSERTFDYVYAGGEEAVLSFVLTWWDDSVAQALEASPVSNNIGRSDIYDMGTMMGQEGKAAEIWYAFTFRGPGGPTVGSAPHTVERTTFRFQEGGRHYVQAVFWGPEQDETGTKERKKHMVFRAWKKMSIVGGVPTFTLFDFNMAGLPALAMG